MKFCQGFLIFWSCFFCQQIFAENIGLLIMATGKYIQFVDPLINSAEKYFCPNHKVTYFVFTDQEMEDRENVVKVFQSRLGWPYDTLMRYETYYSSKEIIEDQDYLFACDADMLFVDEVGDEILGKLVAAQHPGFIGKRGSYETNPCSTACVYDHEGEQYFAGGFYGGITEEVLKIFQTNIQNIYKDFENEFIAVWHDESHWNRYCIDHKPTVILSPSYLYPESWELDYPKKLLALDKNHEEVRK